MKRDWKRQLRAFIARHEGASGIVYCLSRKKTEETAALLGACGVRALAYHAGMDTEAREEHQNVFMTEPGVVIVATIAFGMGIDKAHVRYVFHPDLPGSVEAYYQEIGRAGRDGARAEAHMLYGLADIRMRRQFIEDEDAGEERRRREHKRLDALLGYCEVPAGDAARVLRRADRAVRQLRRVPRPVGAHRRHRGCAQGAVGGAGVGGALRRRAPHRHRARDIDREGRAVRTRPAAGLRDRCGSGQERVALDRAPDGGDRVPAPRHRGLRRHRYHRQGPRPGARRRRVPVPRRYSDRARSRARAPARSPRAPERALDGGDATLLAGLKALRLELAKARGVPAYIVFPDRTLADMVRRRTRTEAEFAEVNGVGAAKLKQFAEPFLAAINGAPSDAGRGGSPG